MYTTARRLSGLDSDDNLPVQLDLPAAKALFQRCIDEDNNPYAMHDLAHLLTSPSHASYFDAKYAAQLYETCLTITPHPHAMYSLAELLRNSRGVSRDVPRAVALYEKSIQISGHLDALISLADIFNEGASGVPPDLLRALRLYERFSEVRSDERVLITLAEIYLKAGEMDLERALQICGRVAVEFGYSSVLSLADRMADGRLAVKLLEMCVEGGQCDALMDLAKLLTGFKGVEKDAQRVAELCERYIEREDCQPVITLAEDLSIRQSDYPQDFRLARALLKICIEKANSLEACFSYTNISLADASDIQAAMQCAISTYEAKIDEEIFRSALGDLAAKLTHGALQSVYDVPLAIRICEMCLPYNDKGIMFTLARILLCTTPSRNPTRALNLFQQLVSDPDSATDILYLIPSIAKGDDRNQCDVPTAIQLCQLLISEDDSASAKATLAEILAASPNPDIDRILTLCRSAIVEAPDEVTWLAKAIVEGSDDVRQNINLGMQIFEICIEDGSSRALISVVELLLFGHHGVERDVERGVGMFVEFLRVRKEDYMLPQFAKKVVDGGGDLEKVGLRMLESCVENGSSRGMYYLAEVLREREGSVAELRRADSLFREAEAGGFGNELDVEEFEE